MSAHAIHALLGGAFQFLALVARAGNCSLGRWEALWERDSYSAVRLETAATILEKIVYVLANPVAAGLVRRGSDWPGLWSDPALMGGEGVVLERPKEFFRADGPLPATARLRFHPPPEFENPSELAAGLLSRLRQAEDHAAAELASSGRSFMGVARVLAQKPDARPAPGEPRRGLSPRVACRNKWKRIEALLRLAEFRTAYREALAAWRAGARDVTFPPGTWSMRVQHRVYCPAPA